MRRLSDGVKTTDRYKTTEQVERAYVEDRPFTYLFQDGEGYTFMNTETYEQVIVPKEVIGDQAAYPQENMEVMMSLVNGVAADIVIGAARVRLGAPAPLHQDEHHHHDNDRWAAGDHQ